jgi:hypothetical protein
MGSKGGPDEKFTTNRLQPLGKKRSPVETIFSPSGETEKAPLPKYAPPAAPAAATPAAAAAPLDWSALSTAAPAKSYRAATAPLAANRKAASVIATGYGF